MSRVFKNLPTGRPPNEPEALWKRVQVGAPDDCWPWLGAKRRRGYGVISIKQRDYVTHRLAYELATGDDPGESFVCHRCDNPSCCNPAHLFLGSHADNVADMLRKGRHGGKLTSTDVHEIRRRRAAGETTTSLARAYGVGSPHISRITRYPDRYWRHAA